MSSIRGRLIARLLPAWLALLAGGALALEYGFERYLLHELDRALEHKARTLATLVFDRGDDLEIQFADELMPEFSAPREPEYFEILDDSGTVLERSLSLGPSGIDGAPAGTRAIEAWSWPLPDGRAGRAIGLRLQAHYEPRPDARRAAGAAESPWVSIRVARSREELERVIGAMQVGLLLVCALLGVAVTATVLRAVRVGLRPLEQLATAVARIDPQQPRLELDAREVPNELEPIHARLTDLLARLDAALARERRFTSAAAHELRTPITELRALSEVALKWPGDSAHLPRATLELALQMEGVVASLLDLTRADTGRVELRDEQVFPCQWIDATLASNAAAVAEKHLRVELACEPWLAFHTDPRLAHSTLRNLVENALLHAPPDGRVSIRARVEAGWFELEVTNSRGTFAEADLPHLGEPFWRKDTARGDRAHVGLGLAITRSFARALGGEVEFSVDGELVHAHLRLPAPRA